MDIMITIFSTFVAFCGSVLFVTEAINKMFKVEDSNIKVIVSWVTSFALAAVGLALQLGIFNDCGPVTEWQAWVKAMLIGLGCGWCSNKMYDQEEMWRLLEYLFSFFEKDGKMKRIAMREERKRKREIERNR